MDHIAGDLKTTPRVSLSEIWYNSRLAMARSTQIEAHNGASTCWIQRSESGGTKRIHDESILSANRCAEGLARRMVVCGSTPDQVVRASFASRIRAARLIPALLREPAIVAEGPETLRLPRRSDRNCSLETDLQCSRAALAANGRSNQFAALCLAETAQSQSQRRVHCATLRHPPQPHPHQPKGTGMVAGAHNIDPLKVAGGDVP